MWRAHFNQDFNALRNLFVYNLRNMELYLSHSVFYTIEILALCLLPLITYSFGYGKRFYGNNGNFLSVHIQFAGENYGTFARHCSCLAPEMNTHSSDGRLLVERLTY